MLIYYIYDAMSSEVVAYFSTQEKAEAYKNAMLNAGDIEDRYADQYVTHVAGVDPVYVMGAYKS